MQELRLIANLIKDGLVPGTLLTSDHIRFMLVCIVDIRSGGQALLLSSDNGALTWFSVRELRQWIGMRLLRVVRHSVEQSDNNTNNYENIRQRIYNDGA